MAPCHHPAYIMGPWIEDLPSSVASASQGPASREGVGQVGLLHGLSPDSTRTQEPISLLGSQRAAPVALLTVPAPLLPTLPSANSCQLP